MTARRSRAAGALLAAGIVIVLVGGLTALGLWYSAGQRYEDAVRNLARAPAGCVTTLDFAEPGEYLLFSETRGTIGRVVGDCAVTGDFDWVGDEIPMFGMTMIDPLGEELPLDGADEIRYDAAGSVGEAVRVVQVDTAGDHLLTVEPGSQTFAIAVGRDPHDGVGSMRVGAAIAAITGLIVGGVLLVMATRTRQPAVTSSSAWPGAGDWITSPPRSAGVPADWQPAIGPPTAPAPPPPGAGQIPQGWQVPGGWQIPGQPPIAPPRSDPPAGADGERSPWAAPGEDSGPSRDGPPQ